MKVLIGIWMHILRKYFAFLTIASVVVALGVLYKSGDKPPSSIRSDAVEVTLAGRHLSFDKKILDSRYRDGGEVSGIILTFDSEYPCESVVTRKNKVELADAYVPTIVALSEESLFDTTQTYARTTLARDGLELQEGWNTFSHVEGKTYETVIARRKEGVIDPILYCGDSVSSKAVDQRRCTMQFRFRDFGAIAYVSLSRPSHAKEVYEDVICRLNQKMK